MELKQLAVNPDKKIRNIKVPKSRIALWYTRQASIPYMPASPLWQLSRRIGYAPIAWSQSTLLGSALVSTNAKCVRVHTTQCSILTEAIKGNWTGPGHLQLMIGNRELSRCIRLIQAAMMKCCFQHTKWRWSAPMTPSTRPKPCWTLHHPPLLQGNCTVGS